MQIRSHACTRLGVVAALIFGASARAQEPTLPLPSSLHGQVNLEQTDDGSPLRLHLNARMRGSVPHGVATVPMQLRGGQLVLPGIIIFEPRAPNEEHAVDALLDTSAQGAVLLSNSAAAAYDPWIALGVPAESVCNIRGAFESRVGALGGLRLGPISIEPAPVRIGAPCESVVIGMEALTAFEGAIFDWDRGQLHLVVRRTLFSADDPPSRGAIDALAARREWMTIPLRMDTRTEAFDEFRHVMISTRSMWPSVSVQIDSMNFIALIDTGYEGDVLLREGVDWPLEGQQAEAAPGSETNAAMSLELRRLQEPLVIGTLRYSDVNVETGWSPPPGMENLHIDAVIGMGLLRRAPMWMDFHERLVRFWTGSKPFPGLSVDGK